MVYTNIIVRRTPHWDTLDAVVPILCNPIGCVGASVSGASTVVFTVSVALSFDTFPAASIAFTV